MYYNLTKLPKKCVFLGKIWNWVWGAFMSWRSVGGGITENTNRISKVMGTEAVCKIAQYLFASFHSTTHKKVESAKKKGNSL